MKPEVEREYRQARPVIRAISAFILFLRFGHPYSTGAASGDNRITVEESFDIADQFLTGYEMRSEF